MTLNDVYKIGGRNRAESAERRALFHVRNVRQQRRPRGYGEKRGRDSLFPRFFPRRDCRGDQGETSAHRHSPSRDLRKDRQSCRRRKQSRRAGRARDGRKTHPSDRKRHLRAVHASKSRLRGRRHRREPHARRDAFRGAGERTGGGRRYFRGREGRKAYADSGNERRFGRIRKNIRRGKLRAFRFLRGTEKNFFGKAGMRLRKQER